MLLSLCGLFEALCWIYPYLSYSGKMSTRCSIQMCLSRVEQRWRIKLIGCKASLMSSCPSGHPGPSLPSWFLADCPSACPWSCYSSPGARLHTSFCWNSWGSSWFISSACPGTSEQQHRHLVCQPLLTVFANFLKAHTDPASRSLMKMTDNIASTINPWTPLVTGHQLGFMLLVTMAWPQQFSWFFSSPPYPFI